LVLVLGAVMPICASVVGISGTGWLVTISTVRSSVALAWIVVLPNKRIVSRHASSGTNWRLSALTTAAALNGVPSWNFTPSRSVMRHVSGST
jgi:hypothetical protein